MHESLGVVCHLVSRVIDREEVSMRYIGLDVHREFCEVAILDHVSLFGAGVSARPIRLPISKPREARRDRAETGYLDLIRDFICTCQL